jgi:hypothetical protein
MTGHIDGQQDRIDLTEGATRGSIVLDRGSGSRLERRVVVRARSRDHVPVRPACPGPFLEAIDRLIRQIERARG